MNQKRTLALLVCALLLFSSPATAQVLFIGSDDVINRHIDRSTAKTLDYLPEVARARTDTLVIGVSDMLGETNPFWVGTVGDNYLASLLYDELLFANNNDEVGAGVAAYSVSADGTTLSFTIRDGVTYADGAPVTSDDFINALYLLLMPEYDGVYDLTRAGILGVDSFLAGRADHIAGISRADERSFHVTMGGVSASTPMYFAIPALRVSVFGDLRSREAFEDAGATLERVRAADAAEMAYGQYTLSSLEPGMGAALAANDVYWRGKPSIGSVELQVVPFGFELQAIMDGSVDIISMLGSVEAVDTVVDFETGFINLYTWEGDVLGYLGMDLESPLFSQASVRQALAVGFDREAARKNRIERYGVVPDMILYDQFSMESKELLDGAFDYDPERAARLLDEAGWGLSDDGLRYRDGEPFTFTLLYNTPNPVMDAVLQQMQQDYQALGVTVVPEGVPFETLLERVDAGEYEMYFQARQLPAIAALASDLFVGGSHLNGSGYGSDLTERLLRMADASTDEERQNVLYEMIFQEIATDMPVIPVYRRSEFLLVSARVMNVTVTAGHDITADVYRFFFTDTLEGQW